MSFSLYIKDPSASESSRVKQRQALLQEWSGSKVSAGVSELSFDPEIIGKKNCENLVGQISLPLGVAGPLTIHNDLLDEDVVVPLATTEGALVASVNRGCKIISHSGGTAVLMRRIGISRAPVFQCRSGAAAVVLAEWIETHVAEWRTALAATSSHLQLLNVQTWVRGRLVYARFVANPDQAMGMNMITIGLSQAWQQLQTDYPELSEVELLTLSSNVCTDKKDSAINRILGRGFWVQAEVVIPHPVLEKVAKVSAQQLLQTHVAKNLMGSNLAGSFSQNMHAANIVAALYAATGQDLAHAVEGSQATTTVEMSAEGVYVAVTLPDVVVGVVGGGTGLPAQTAARSLTRKNKQPLSAEQLAVVVGGAVLAGEISGLAALASHSLASAHQRLGRGKK